MKNSLQTRYLKLTKELELSNMNRNYKGRYELDESK